MPRTFHSGEYAIFSTMLADRRKKAGLTQAELARSIGKPQSYVAKYERGERRLDVIELLRIAEAIGFDASAFIRDVSKRIRA